MAGAKQTGERSLKYLRDNGYKAGVVERYNSFIHQRFDLFNIIDIIAIKDGETLGVQTTTHNSASAHRKKIREEPLLQDWLRAGNKFELHIWRKVGNRWKPKVEEFV